MAKIPEHCINAAKEILQTFSEKELKDYTRKVLSRARELDPLRGSQAIKQSMAEAFDQKMESFFHESVQIEQDALAYDANVKPINDGKADIIGLVAGRQIVRARDAYRKRNLVDSRKAAFNEFVNQHMNIFTPEEYSRLHTGKDDKVIRQVVSGKTNSDDPFVNKVSDEIKKYWDNAQTQLVLSGAMTPEEFNPRRFFGAIHDRDKIMNFGRTWREIAKLKSTGKFNPMAAKEPWIDEILKHIDKEEMFKDTHIMDIDGNISDAKVRKFFGAMYDNIITGKNDILSRSKVVSGIEQIKKRSKMVNIFKNFDDQMAYNDKFGSGNLLQTWVSDMRATANKVGASRLFGSDPTKMYYKLKEAQIAKSIKDEKPKSDSFYRSADNYFSTVTGSGLSATNPTRANAFANVRALNASARLFNIVIKSISDAGFVGTAAERFGANAYSTAIYGFKHIFNNNIAGDEQRIHIARQFRADIDNTIGHMTRFAQETGASGLVNKWTAGVFKYNGLEAWDKGWKNSTSVMISRSLADKSHLSWGELPDHVRDQVSRFIDGSEWDLLRTKNQNGLFALDNVNSLTDAEIKAHYETTDKSIPLHQMRSDLYGRVYGMFNTNIENSILAPSAFAKAHLYAGTDPGSKLGIVLRNFTQFKMFGLEFFDKVLLDGLAHNPGVSQKMLWAGRLASITIPLALLGNEIDYLSQGTTAPDPRQMNVPERVNYFANLIVPSLAVYFGLLRPGMSDKDAITGSLLTSPTITFMNNLYGMARSLVYGDTKRAAKDATNVFDYIFPTNSMPIISPLYREATGQKGYMEPGQERLFGA